jgi:hypothetical protein
MPLSEYEQRVLEQMEQQLSSDDPRLVHTLQGAPSSLRRWLLTGIGVLIGVTVLLVGAVSGEPVIGVLGFVIMFVSVVMAFSPPPRRGPKGTVRADGTVKRPKGPSRMQRLEERWERRRNENGR